MKSLSQKNRIIITSIFGVSLLCLFFLNCGMPPDSEKLYEYFESLGSYGGGIVALIMGIWLIYGYFQQEEQIKLNTDAMNKMIKATSDLVEMEKQKQLYKIQPRFCLLEFKEREKSINEPSITFINNGSAITNVLFLNTLRPTSLFEKSSLPENLKVDYAHSCDNPENTETLINSHPYPTINTNAKLSLIFFNGKLGDKKTVVMTYINGIGEREYKTFIITLKKPFPEISEISAADEIYKQIAVTTTLRV